MLYSYLNVDVYIIITTFVTIQFIFNIQFCPTHLITNHNCFCAWFSRHIPQKRIQFNHNYLLRLRSILTLSVLFLFKFSKPLAASAIGPVRFFSNDLFSGLDRALKSEILCHLYSQDSFAFTIFLNLMNITELDMFHNL